MVTLAPAIDACLVSTTRPVIREVLVCAVAAVLNAAIKVATRMCSRMRRCMERPPFSFEAGKRKGAGGAGSEYARLERRKTKPNLRSEERRVGKECRSR